MEEDNDPLLQALKQETNYLNQLLTSQVLESPYFKKFDEQFKGGFQFQPHSLDKLEGYTMRDSSIVTESNSSVKTFIQNSIVKLKKCREKLDKCKDYKKVVHRMIYILERVRLYTDGFIYPRDSNLQIQQLKILEEKKENITFLAPPSEGQAPQKGKYKTLASNYSSASDKNSSSDSQSSIDTQHSPDFLATYKQCFKIIEKVQKWERKELEYSHRLEMKKLESQNPQILKMTQEEISRHVKFFSHSLGELSVQDYNQFRQSEIHIQINIKSFIEVSSGYMHIQFALFNESGAQISEPFIFDNETPTDYAIFDNIRIENLLQQRLYLVSKLIEVKVPGGGNFDSSIRIGTMNSRASHESMKMVSGPIDDNADYDSELRNLVGYMVFDITESFFNFKFINKFPYKIEEQQLFLTDKPAFENKISELFDRKTSSSSKLQVKGIEIFKELPLEMTLFDRPCKRSSDPNDNTPVVDLYNNQLASLFDRYNQCNEIRLQIKNCSLPDLAGSKAKRFRLVFFLRGDESGANYDCFFYSRQSKVVLKKESYESIIVPLQQAVNFNETFYITVPTSDFEVCRDLHLMVLFQVERVEKVKKTKQQIIRFESIEFAIIPLIDLKRKQIINFDLQSYYAFEIGNNDLSSFRIQDISKYKQKKDFLLISAHLISNKIPKDRYIKEFLLLQSNIATEQELDQALNRILNIPPDQLIIFHDKLLDKLFNMFEGTNCSEKLQRRIIITILFIFDKFHEKFPDQKYLLDNYIDKHFAKSKLYMQIITILQQAIMDFDTKFDSMEHQQILLYSFKYISLLVRIIKRSFKEDEYNFRVQIQTQMRSRQSLRPLNDDSRPNNLIQPMKQRQQIPMTLAGDEKSSFLLQDDEMDYGPGFGFQNQGDLIRQPAEAVRTITNQSQTEESKLIQTEITFKNTFVSNLENLMNLIFDFSHRNEFKLTLYFRSKLYENMIDLCDTLTSLFEPEKIGKLFKYLADTRVLNQTYRTATESIREEADQSQNGSFGKSTNANMNNMVLPGQSIIDNYVENVQLIEELKQSHNINDSYIQLSRLKVMSKIIKIGFVIKHSQAFELILPFLAFIEERIMSEENRIYCLQMIMNLIVLVGKRPDLVHKVSNFLTSLLPNISLAVLKILKSPKVDQKLIDSDPNLLQQMTPLKEKVGLIFLSVLHHIQRSSISQELNDVQLLPLLDNLRQLQKEICFMNTPIYAYFEYYKIAIYFQFYQFIGEQFKSQSLQKLKDPTYETLIIKYLKRFVVLIISYSNYRHHMSYTTRKFSGSEDSLKSLRPEMLSYFSSIWDLLTPNIENIVTIFKHPHTKMMKQFQEGIEENSQLYLKVVADVFLYEFQKSGSRVLDKLQVSQNDIFTFIDQAVSQEQPDIADRFCKGISKFVKNDDKTKTNEQFLEAFKAFIQKAKTLKNLLFFVQLCKKNNENYLYQNYSFSKLLQFFEQNHHYELYRKYITEMKSINKTLNNFAEAAQCDYKHSKLINIIEVSQDVNIKGFIRVQLLEDSAANFSKAHLYEKGIEVMEEIRYIQERELCQFIKVADTLTKEAKLYHKIGTKQRYYSTYFKIGFFGVGYHYNIQNKEFVYRADRLAKRVDVVAQLQEFYPDAKLLYDTQEPSQDIKQSLLKYLQITPLKPLSLKDREYFGLPFKTELVLKQHEMIENLPVAFKSYYEQNFVKKFYIEKSIKNHEDDVQRDTEIQIFYVQDEFPSISKMQEIKKQKNLLLSGIQYAIRKIKQQNHQLINLNEEVKKGGKNQKSDLVILTNFVQSAIESPIQGGTPRYVNVFTTDEYMQKDPTNVKKHVQIVENALATFSLNTDNDGLRSMLQGEFNDMRARYIQLNQILIQ